MKQNDRPARRPQPPDPPREVDKLLAATTTSRNAARDRCLLLLMFRHGLRV